MSGGIGMPWLGRAFHGRRGKVERMTMYEAEGCRAEVAGRPGAALRFASGFGGEAAGWDVLARQGWLWLIVAMAAAIAAPVASAVAAPPAPSVAAAVEAGGSALGDSSAVFIFYGLVYHEDGMTPWADPDTLILRNLRTGVIVRSLIGAQGRSGYAAVVVDLAGSAAAVVGDSIAASCSSPRFQPIPMAFVIGSEDVQSGFRLTSFRMGDLTSHAGSFPDGIVRPLSAFPNPSRTGVVHLELTIARAPGSGWPEALRVFDAQGRLVRSLPMSFVEAGMGESTWDGRDAAGRRLAPGRYWARLGPDGPGRSVSFVLKP
jgi:hypothetical protein